MSRPEDELQEVLPEATVRFEHARGRRAIQVAWAGIVLLALAFLKPWAGAPAETPGPPQAASAATPAPTAVAVAQPCLGGRWLVEADERWVGEVMRTWVLTDAVEASDPLDPRIHFATVAAQQVVALGFCPARTDDAGRAARATFFRIDGAPVAVDTTQVEIPAEAEAMANLLYRPVAAGRSGASPQPLAAWPAGRYVMRIDGPGGYRRWLGIEVRVVLDGVLPSINPSPSPSPVGGGSPSP